GDSRAVLLLVACFALLLGGCGKSGQGAETDPEKGSDAEHLNTALAQERELLDAYTEAMPALSGSGHAVARRFRAHQQEYVDAIAKALRGLGGRDEAEPVDVDLRRLKGQPELLGRLYALEGAGLAASLDAAPLLFTSAPRTLTASLAAGHAQHLVVLRQQLGASALESAAEGFDSGEEPPPGAR
ncbi:MAG TPA: ferritin-like domain-containing protein, partial [Solirubrobacterales bacterium]|nr:ferritin-like domain-containing protein [Solirubrobacterales bacterium]